MAHRKESEEWRNERLGVQRGDYGKNLIATLLLAAGRLTTGPIQYAIIASQPLSRFGVLPPPTGGFITILGYTAPRLQVYTALMPGVHGIKHAVWATTMAKERMTLHFALFAIISDLLYEAISSTIFSAASINPLWSERFFYAGMTIFYTSAAVELIAELQRIAFKSRPENEGKLCTTGFWGITRHINYTANVLFGFGYGLATGGPLYSIATTGMYLSNFTLNAIPSIEEYCRRKYGKVWRRYESEVPYKLIPGIY